MFVSTAAAVASFLLGFILCKFFFISNTSSGSSSPSRPNASNSSQAAIASRSRPVDRPMKMILAVRGDLGMGKGKQCAQCCHASVGVVLDMIDRGERDHVDIWEKNGAMKIAVKVSSEEELLSLQKAAKKDNLPHYLVVDAGHTQIAPMSKTVLAIGPAPVAAIDAITSHLKLL